MLLTARYLLSQRFRLDSTDMVAARVGMEGVAKGGEGGTKCEKDESKPCKTDDILHRVGLCSHPLQPQQ